VIFDCDSKAFYILDKRHFNLKMENLPSFLFLWGSRHLTGLEFKNRLLSYDSGKFIIEGINHTHVEGTQLWREEDRERYRSNLRPETFDWVEMLPPRCQKTVVLEFGLEELLSTDQYQDWHDFREDIMAFYWESAKLAMKCPTIEERTQLVICELVAPPGVPDAMMWKIEWFNWQLRRFSNMFAHVSFLSLRYRFCLPPIEPDWFPQPDPENFLESIFWLNSKALEEYARLILVEVNRRFHVRQNEHALDGPRPPEVQKPFQISLFERLGSLKYFRWQQQRDLANLLKKDETRELIESGQEMTKSFLLLHNLRDTESNAPDSDQEDDEGDEDETDDSGMNVSDEFEMSK